MGGGGGEGGSRKDSEELSERAIGGENDSNHIRNSWLSSIEASLVLGTNLSPAVSQSRCQSVFSVQRTKMWPRGADKDQNIHVTAKILSYL